MNVHGAGLDSNHKKLLGHPAHVSRREFLYSASRMAAGALLASNRLDRQSTALPSSTKGGRIDVHHHVLPPPYMLRARDRVLAISDRDHSRLLNWTPEGAIEVMDRADRATAITSLGLPGVWFGGARAARSLARLCNEYCAKMVSD